MYRTFKRNDKRNYLSPLLLFFCIYSAQAFEPPKVLVSAVYAGAINMNADIDEREIDGGIEFNYDLANAEGKGIELLLRPDREGLGIAFTHLKSEHTDKNTQTLLNNQLTLVEADLRAPYFGEDAAAVTFGFRLGLGVSSIRRPISGYKEQAAGSLGAYGEVKLAENLVIKTGGTYFHAGKPTETVLHGTYFYTTVGLRF